MLRPLSLSLLASLAAVLVGGGAALAAQMDFQITSDTGDTYRAAITIENPDDRRVTDWRLELTLDRTVVQTFGAQMTQLAADRYRFTPTEWTKEIAPGGQAKFTMVGKPGNLRVGPQDVKLDVSFAPAVAAAPSAPAAAPPPAAPAPARPAAPPAQNWAERPTSGERPAAAERPSAPGKPARGSGIAHIVAFKLKGAWNNGFTAEVAVVNNTDRMIRPWRLELAIENKIEEMWDAQFRQIGEGRYLVTPRDYNQELPPGGFVVFGFKGADAFRSRPTDTKLAEGG